MLIVLAMPFVVLASMRLVGAEGDKYTIAALALTPYAAVGGLVLGAVALLLRRWWTGGIVLLLAIALMAMVVPGHVRGRPAARLGQAAAGDGVESPGRTCRRPAGTWCVTTGSAC